MKTTFIKLLPALLLAFGCVYGGIESANSMDAIHSGIPWFDDRGKIISAHGAGIIKEGGLYYLFGEFKSDEGNAFKGFSCYRSPDLLNWTFRKIALPIQDSGRLGPERVGERPKVMKCPKTGQFVMYMHSDNLEYKDPAVCYATCDTIDGVYTFQGPLQKNGSLIRKWDMGVFQDDDGTGYLITHSGSLYRLSEDYKSVVETMVDKMTDGCEAPAIFKRDGVYYWLGSDLTGWERNDNIYFTASSLKGPWTKQGHFAPAGSLTWNSQTTFVLPVVGSKTTTYIFMGDRWAYPYQNSAATYIWQPLVFKDDTLSLTEFRQSWNIDLKTGDVYPYTLRGNWIAHTDSKRLRHSDEWSEFTDAKGFSDLRSNVKGASLSLDFTGSQIGLFGVARPDGGFARIEIKDSKGNTILTTVIETYCAYPESSLKFLSPKLEKADYTLTVTPLGTHFSWKGKNARISGSTGDFVSVDRFLIVD